MSVDHTRTSAHRSVVLLGLVFLAVTSVGGLRADSGSPSAVQSDSPASRAGGRRSEAWPTGVRSGSAQAAATMKARLASAALRSRASGGDPGGMLARAAVAAGLPGSLTRDAGFAGLARDPKLLAQLKKALEQLQKLWVADQRDAIWVGNERCLECHEEYGQEGRSSLYALYTRSREILLPFRRGCEGCHGPGSKHAAGDLRAVTNPRNLTKARIADLCLSCHTVKRLVGDPDFHIPGHSANHVGCLNCHSVHHPAASKNLKQEPNRLCLACHGDIKAQLTLRSRHPVLPEKSSLTLTSRSDKVLCIDCHRPYTRTGDSVGREPQQATCQRCHPDTRGPFLFGHDGGSPEVSKGCTTCHLPHGSPHRHLLRMQGRSLCVSCHTDQATTHYPGPSCTVSGCHQSIHGSNLNQFFLK